MREAVLTASSRTSQLAFHFAADILLLTTTTVLTVVLPVGTAGGTLRHYSLCLFYVGAFDQHCCRTL
jgi:hypothetical protein